MIVVAIACARDEADIIEPFVRHTLTVAERLVVLDNGSTDGTREILASLVADGLPVDVVDDRSPGKYLSERMTRLMHDEAIGRHHADWILPLDADEFVVAPAGGTLVSNGDEGQPHLLPWRTYVPHISDDAADRNPATRIRHRIAGDTDPFSKLLVPVRLGRQRGAVILQGSHELAIDGRLQPGQQHEHAFLAHIPIRTPAQFLVKTIIGHLQNEIVPLRDARLGWHHRQHYERLASNPAAVLNDLAALGTRYANQDSQGPVPTVEDPLPYGGGPLRYTPGTADPLQAWPPVLRYVQDLARRHAALSASAGARLEERSRALEDLRIEVQHLVEELERARRSRDRLQASWTWKAGRLALFPARLLKHGWALSRRAVR